ncbi:MAG: hypothetical protein ACFFCS_11360 [Candidatus Hodarchaeota archaeon]
MKSSSYALMEKLRALFKQAKYSSVMEEINHYLLHLNGYSESPLINELIELLKEVIYKDIDNLHSNLESLQILFKNTKFAIQKDILEIFLNLSTIERYRTPLFDKYYASFEEHFKTADDDARSKIIHIMFNLSRDSDIFQEIIIKFFLDNLDNVNSTALLRLMSSLKELIDFNPSFEALFETKVDALLDRYFFERGNEIQESFLSLFSYLTKYQEQIIERCLKWLDSTDLVMKKKVMKLFPVIVENRFDPRYFEALIDELMESDDEYQASVVETLNSIANTNYNYNVSYVIKRFFDSSFQENELQGLAELITMLASKDFILVFKKIYQMFNLSDEPTIKKTLLLMKNLDFEYPHQLEYNLFKVFDPFLSFHWQLKIETLAKVHLIIGELKRDFLVEWFARILHYYMDPEIIIEEKVLEKKSDVLNELYFLVPGLDEKIAQINNKITHIEKTIQQSKNYPRILRERYSKITEISTSNFQKILDKDYNSFLERIFDFEDFINNLEFKHLIHPIVDEWYHARDYIIEDLEIVKHYLDELIKERYLDFKSKNEEVFENLDKKREILEIELEEITRKKEILDKNDEHGLSDLLSKVSAFSTNLSIIDMEIGQMVILHPEQIKIHKQFFERWNASKKRMEADINKIIDFFDKWLENLSTKQESKDIIEFGSKLIRNIYSKYVRASIKDYNQIMKEISEYDIKINELIAINDFETAEKTLDYSNSKYMDLISQKTRHIEKYMKKISYFTTNIEILINAKRLHEDWINTKTNLTGRINDFYKEKMEIMDAEKIKQMIKLVNPIPIEILRNKLRSIEEVNDAEYIDRVLDLIQKYNINVQVHEKNLMNIKHFSIDKRNEDLLSIKTKFRLEGNHIFLKVAVKNNSLHEIFDLTVSLKLPDFLEFAKSSRDNIENQKSILAPDETFSNEWDLLESFNEMPGENKKIVMCSKILIFTNGKISADKSFTQKRDVNLIYKKI